MSSPSGVWGGAPEASALFMFLEGKIQRLINIPAPNLLKLTSRKRDIHESKYVKWGMMTLTQYYTVQYNDFNTANPNILLIKVLRSHLQLWTSQTQIPIKFMQTE